MVDQITFEYSGVRHTIRLDNKTVDEVNAEIRETLRRNGWTEHEGTLLTYSPQEFRITDARWLPATSR